MKGRRKKKTNISNIPDPNKVSNIVLKNERSEEQIQHMSRVFGLFTGIISKALLERGGCVVDYKINGEDIMEIEKLNQFDISERIALAVKEERYEDAMNLKKILDYMNNKKQLSKND